jgi:hypothetical protein
VTIGDRLKRLAEIARAAGYVDPRCPSITWVDEQAARGANAGKGYFQATGGFSGFDRLQSDISAFGETPEAALDALVLVVIRELDKERSRLAKTVAESTEAYDRIEKALLEVSTA